MQLSVEISKYPLADDYITPIKGFIEQLNQYPDIKVLTNTMSTQLFGEYDTVMQALQACIKWSFEHYGKVVFVVKFIHGDLRP
ncbi:YkoF family thiamine/hydroxymethylpyrimidine-binding protein [Rheinheimera fenheensis]|uniref:YkoF family thiamine/hydroxymethylpyrimidine-binding protein n=1 Tax=Rheinheimera fenheensis TaxID=3152295 RepID=UPI00325EB9ED